MGQTKIVILNWNGRRHLEQFLPKVIASTPCDVGIVVADNGSDDSSLEFLEEYYPSVELLIMEDNYGYAGGYNRALAMLKSDYFVLMNSDVEPVQGWFEPLSEAMDADEKLVAVAPKILSYSDRDRFEYAGASGGFMDVLGYPFCRGRILSSVELDNGQYDDMRHAFWVSGACMMVRADKFAELGGFDEKFFVHMEEIDFCWRAQIYGYSVAVVPQSKVYHLGGGTLPNNSPKKLYYNFRNNLAMLYKNLPEKWFRKVLVSRIILDCGSAIVYFLIGKWELADAVRKAHRDFRSWRRELKQQQELIAASAKIYELDTIYRGSILLRYLFVGRTFDKMM